MSVIVESTRPFIFTTGVYVSKAKEEQGKTVWGNPVAHISLKLSSSRINEIKDMCTQVYPHLQTLQGGEAGEDIGHGRNVVVIKIAVP